MKDWLIMNQLIKTLGYEDLVKGYASLKYFTNNINRYSYTEREPFIPGEHINLWCDMMQSRNSCIISSRKHSKSKTIYSYIKWEISKALEDDLEILYMSYKDKLSKYHIHKVKNEIRINPYFRQLHDITPPNVEGIAKYTWNGKNRITISPAGITSFERGAHCDILILDDVLADPTDQLNLAIIHKINQRVKEVAFSIPKEGGKIQIVGTAQSPSDFLFDLKDDKSFRWGMFPAVKDWVRKITLWPEMFSWERLMQIKNLIGVKAFEKEYQVKPVWSADSFFKQDDIMRTVNPKLKNYNSLVTKNDVRIGWDIGKHSHPAYATVFEFFPIGNVQGQLVDLAVQRHVKWMDGWEYKSQLDYVKGLVDRFNADKVNYDNTRGELEGFYEKGYMAKNTFFPIHFDTKTKNKMATEYERRVCFQNEEGKPSPLIQHINHQRSINQVLVVTNDLQAVVTHEGHGDAFFGNALALMKGNEFRITFLQDEDNVLGFK